MASYNIGGIMKYANPHRGAWWRRNAQSIMAAYRIISLQWLCRRLMASMASSENEIEIIGGVKAYVDNGVMAK
jgi:hypothetical protein